MQLGAYDEHLHCLLTAPADPPPPPHPPSRTHQATMAAAEAGARFDLGGLRSPAERLLLELGATLLSQGALVREPGRLLVTDQRLYFQVPGGTGVSGAAGSDGQVQMAGGSGGWGFTGLGCWCCVQLAMPSALAQLAGGTR